MSSNVTDLTKEDNDVDNVPNEVKNKEVVIVIDDDQNEQQNHDGKENKNDVHYDIHNNNTNNINIIRNVIEIDSNDNNVCSIVENIDCTIDNCNNYTDKVDNLINVSIFNCKERE